MAIQGLDTFNRFFADFTDHYLLIGGVACHLAMEQAGLEFRATKDLDVVLVAEALTPAFAKQFWRFIEEAGYQQQQKSEQRQFYRFVQPKNNDFPVMIELFSRVPNQVVLVGDAHLTPIPMGDEAQSLSAILLDDDYYQCIKPGRTVIDNVPLLGPEYVLPFKARAWLDLTARKAAGEQVDSRNIKKHRNDVFRLFQLLSPQQTVQLSPSVRNDLQQFVQAMPQQEGLKLADFGITGVTLSAVLQTITSIYELQP